MKLLFRYTLNFSEQENESKLNISINSEKMVHIEHAQYRQSYGELSENGELYFDRSVLM